jgi:positive regulator of sigma E activity
MREEGIVLEVSGNTAKVTIEPKPQCEHCGLCSRAAGGERVVEADGAGSASPGDKVIIEVSPAQIVRTSLIVYAFPLAALLAGVVLGYFLSDILGSSEEREVFGFGLGVVGVLVSILVLRRYDRRISRTSPPKALIIE